MASRATRLNPGPLYDMSEILTLPVVVVSDLIVHVATGETCYAGENGFSFHWAEVTTEDPVLQETLSSFADRDTQVLLRCARLDVVGRVTKQEKIGAAELFVFRVEDMIFRPTGRIENVV